MSAPDPGSKFRAKRLNEHVKSFYSLANTIGAARILTGFLAPFITKGSANIDVDAPSWVLIGLLSHAVGQFAIWRYMRPEE